MASTSRAYSQKHTAAALSGPRVPMSEIMSFKLASIVDSSETRIEIKKRRLQFV